MTTHETNETNDTNDASRDAAATSVGGRTYYDVLGVPTSADRDAIRTAYRTRIDALRAGTWTGSETDRRAESLRVNDAWNVLCDAFQRERYDAQLADGSAPALPDAPVVSAPRKRRSPAVTVQPFAVGSGPVPDGTAAVLANRINALFTDIMSCFFAFALFQFALNPFLEPIKEGEPMPQQAWLMPTVATFTVVLLVAWFVVPTALRGQTLGQRWFGVRVVRRYNGELPGATRTIYRYGPLVLLVLASSVSAFSLLALGAFFVGLSFLVMKGKRGIPDLMARTVVVDAAPRPPRLLRRRSA
jgi:uncharacterized RDD family membrane protein YckC